MYYIHSCFQWKKAWDVSLGFKTDLYAEPAELVGDFKPVPHNFYTFLKEKLSCPPSSAGVDFTDKTS